MADKNVLEELRLYSLHDQTAESFSFFVEENEGLKELANKFRYHLNDKENYVDDALYEFELVADRKTRTAVLIAQVYDLDFGKQKAELNGLDEIPYSVSQLYELAEQARKTIIKTGINSVMFIGNEEFDALNNFLNEGDEK